MKTNAKKRNRFVLPLLTLILTLTVALSAALAVSADTKVKAYASGDHSAVQIDAGAGTLGQRIHINGRFTGVGICMPTWMVNEGNLASISVYAWTDGYLATLETEPLAAAVYDCKDNATNWLYFDPIEPGEYLILISDVTGTVGAWVMPGHAVSKGYMYQNGAEYEKELEVTILFEGGAPEEPFLPVVSESASIDGKHTPPAEYVIPADSLIYTHEVMPDTWVFTDSLGRTALTHDDVGDPREDRTLAMFYWTWHTSRILNHRAVNVQEILNEHPEAINDYDNPVWPTDNAAFFWDEPIYGYYMTTDSWVLRRQAELLANAGVDAIFTDNTNGTFTWRESYLELFKTWTDAMEDGVRTPKVSFMLPFSASDDARTQMISLYLDIYRNDQYHPLWFYWDGKPMLMGWPSCLSSSNNVQKEIKNFFTFRSNIPGYINNSSLQDLGCWGWLSMYPQAFYYKDAAARKDKQIEQITVGVAMNHNYQTHQLDAMNGSHIAGRSYTSDLSHIGEEGAMYQGYNFAEQWEYALKRDPQVVFVTGWNEWTAGRYDKWQYTENAFPDECCDEYSRDLEPSRGALGDVYYYQLVNYVRRYKGVRPIPAPTPATTVDLTAGHAAWADIGPYYAAYIGNTDDRNATGYGRVNYTEFSGRNDLIGAQVARDNTYLYFHVECAEDITPHTDPLWMVLYIDSDQTAQGWETFDYVVNKSAASADTVVLERFIGDGYKTEKVADCAYAVDGRYMTVKIRKADLGLDGYDFTVNFAWTDNVHDAADTGVQGADGRWTYSTFSGDILDFYVSGDVAPGMRFKYSYISTTENAQIMTPQETTSETTPDTEPATQADTLPETSPVTEPATDAPADTDADTESVTDASGDGCKSVMTLSVLPLLLAAAWVIGGLRSGARPAGPAVRRYRH